jgi:serine/threonine protein kinase
MNSDRWKQVDNLLQATIEHPPGEREAFLRQACAGDLALEREVRSLLASQQEAGSFLERPAKDVAAPKPALDPSLSPDDATQTIYSLIDRTVSHYRIVEKLGSGGMGVVYKAEDSRLGRFVALKFLSEEFAHDSAWMSRFQREARILASLNHPGIAAIYGLEESDGLSAIAMELVEGPTLAERMARGRIPVVETLAIAGQVVEAVEYAHEHGIVHRDLKPANVKLRPDGAIKVLDFGLAKAADPTEVPSATATHTGVVMGTPAYMSPEQAAGLPVDRRADIWAFGVVLFEMLAGCRIYARRTALETMAAVARDEPPWDQLPGETPGPIVHLLRRCLDKDPQSRLRDIGEARIAIEEARTAPSAAASPVRTPGTRTSRIGILAALILLVLLLGGGMLLWFRRPAPDAPRQVVQFDIPPPPGTIFAPSITRQPFAISPDGKRLAFSATDANGTNIWMRDLASPDQHVVPGTEGAWSMFWAPDSRSIFFSVKRILKQANLENGSGRTVAELPYIVQFGTSRSNGDLILYLGAGDIQEVRAQEGNLRKVQNVEGMRWPQFIPGGDRLVYIIYDKQLKQSRAFAAEYGSHTTAPLMRTDSAVQYAPPLRPGEPGYLLFIRGSSLLAQPFDADRFQLAGEPFAIAQNVIYFGPTLSASFSVSENGVLVYQAGFPNSQLKWYNRAGDEVGEVGRPSQFWGNVRISREGRRVAAPVWSPENGAPGIWIFSAAGRESHRLTFPPEVHLRPVWSPDGTRLALGRSQNVGGARLATLDLTGNAAPEGFVSSEEFVATPTDWSADGRFIVLDDGVGQEQHVVWIADVANRKLIPLLKNDFPQWGAAFSPDGKRIAFVSLESGRPEVYVQTFESTPSPHVVGERRQVSRDGAWLVRWRGDGRELFYLGLDNLLRAVPVQGPLEFGEPKPLFRIAGAPQYGTTRDFQFDVSPDGQRFIMPTTGSVPPPPFTVIQNWQDKFHR